MSQTGKFILIADDDSDDVQLFKQAVAEFDSSITCSVAGDGEEVLELLDKQNVPPVFIFLDINMPVMNGWECLAALKKNEVYKDIPVFMYSTSTLKTHVQQSLQLGANGFISKPSNYNEIKRIVRELYTKVVSDGLVDLPPIEGIIFRV